MLLYEDTQAKRRKMKQDKDFPFQIEFYSTFNEKQMIAIEQPSEKVL